MMTISIVNEDKKMHQNGCAAVHYEDHTHERYEWLKGTQKSGKTFSQLSQRLMLSDCARSVQ